MTKRGRPKSIEPYGLPALGYGDLVAPTGDWYRDQLNIERICFRIGHDPREGGLGKLEHFKRFIDLLYNQKGGNRPFLWHRWSEWAMRKFCTELEVAMAGSASAGKTAPAALWAVGSYVADPTHTKVFCFTTTVKEAHDRIWKEIVEFWQALPAPPGKHVPSQNKILGLNYDGRTYGTSSGIYLYAADKSNETSAYNSLIGSKVAKTGEPVEDARRLLDSEEYRDLKAVFEEDHCLDLVLRLQELEQNRRGRIIIIIDEATGVSDKLLDAYLTNLKPGNEGRVQFIVIGNPSSPFDTHGKACQPAAGWASINVGMDEWRTITGGVCLHFDGLKNPRIVDKDDRLIWMPTEKANQDLMEKYGPDSYEAWRMIRGYWAPEGAGNSIYSEADFARSEAMNPEPVTWGYQPPKLLCGFDPAFTSGGDRAVARFGKLGVDATGLQVLEFTEEVTIKPDIRKKDIPVAEQMVIAWKQECLKRGVLPENACFDASGGGVSFAALVQRLWSRQVRGVTSGGKASSKPMPGEKTPDGKPIRGCDKYANRATEIWCGMMPFLRTGQIRGITSDLAKELCSRQRAKKRGVAALDKIQIETKRDYKDREKQSPDSADAANLLVDEAKTRHGFRPADRVLGQEQPTPQRRGDSPWQQLRARARRITNRKALRRG